MNYLELVNLRALLAASESKLATAEANVARAVEALESARSHIKVHNFDWYVLKAMLDEALATIRGETK